MAEQSLLEIIQRAAKIIGLPKPTAAISSSDPQVQQLVELAQVEGDELASSGSWTRVVQRDFVCVAGELQDTEPPDDMRRLVRDGQFWNVSRQLLINGPVSSEEWTYLTTRVAQSEPQYWRLINGKLNIFRAVAGETVRYEYVSKSWIVGGENSESLFEWENDGDQPIFPSRVIKLGVVWRYKHAKGLDYAEDMETYERAKAAEMGDSKGQKPIAMSLHNHGDIPNHFWPGRIDG